VKILYLSAHSILEYDELRLFHQLGYEFLSLGSYINPQSPVDNKRPPIEGAVYQDKFMNLLGRYSRDNLHHELVDPFDVIIVMHIPDWIESNWRVIKKKHVVWRSIGQSLPSIEQRLRPYVKEGLKIVRYSPTEATIPNFVGQDALIRFYKDETEFDGWNGKQVKVITLGQGLPKKTRREHCNYRAFLFATKHLPRVVFGPENEETKIAGGTLTYEQLKQALRDHRVFFYTGTQPAAYTLGFIEAWMTGIPIVAIGPQLGNSIYGSVQQTYEVHQLIENGLNGFWADNTQQLRNYVKELLSNNQLADQISQNGRETALKHFRLDLVKQAWKNFLESL
jgi:glycosyltransferase involved in cell wall biosynthesis